MTCVQNSILEELKRSTADRHKAIETVVPLTKPDLTIAGYADYLEHLLPFYVNLETRLKAVPDLDRAVADIGERWKANALLSDLHHLGREAYSALNRANCFTPDIRSMPQGLGCLYVLEGSTLGGEILMRIVRKRLGGQIEGKTRFLESYGPEIRSKWHSLCEAIQCGVQRPGDRELAIRSAQATFDTLHYWLAQLQSRPSSRYAAHDV